jgi:hypothetical protein
MDKKYLIFSVLIFAFVCVFYAMAWTGPTATPPDQNAPAPINVSDSSQQKDGAFSLKKYLRLVPTGSGTISETDDGIMFYDVSNNAFKCRENGNWLNCVGGFFSKISANLISLLDFGNGRVRITNVATPAGDVDSDVATVGYVKAQMGAPTGIGGTRWYIKITPAKHDGNFGGWPGIDKFCQTQLNPTCVVFSSDILNSAYVAEEYLDFATWDTNIGTQGWWGYRLITAPPNPITAPSNWQAINFGCSGWTSNGLAAGNNFGSVFMNSGNWISSGQACNVPQNVICACLTP